MKLPDEVAPIDGKRYMPEIESAPSAAAIAKAVELLRNAKTPVILAGRVSRDLECLEQAHRAGRTARCSGLHRS